MTSHIGQVRKRILGQDLKAGAHDLVAWYLGLPYWIISDSQFTQSRVNTASLFVLYHPQCDIEDFDGREKETLQKKVYKTLQKHQVGINAIKLFDWPRQMTVRSLISSYNISKQLITTTKIIKSYLKRVTTAEMCTWRIHSIMCHDLPIRKYQTIIKT